MNTTTPSSPPELASTLMDLDSVVQNLLLLLSEKEKTVIVKRFNLDSTRKHTLEEIGKDFSVTRERIRQIEKNALAKMKRNVFNTALTHVHAFSDVILDECGGVSKEDLLVEKLLEASAVADNSNVDVNAVRLALSLHDDLERVGNTIDFYPYIKSKGISDYSLRNAASKTVNQLHKYGDIKPISRLERDLSATLKEFKLNGKLFKSLMGIDKRLKVVDMDKVGLYEWRHIHPRTLRDKIFFILRTEKKPMHFVEIAERISSRNFDNRKVNVQAVHNELIRHKQFVLIGRGIYALGEWGYEKGTVADVVIKILQEKKELSQDQIISEVLKQRKVKEITIVLALKNNARFERVGRKQYKLKK
ncbi:hypothetical protein HOE67_02385 [Candidatus Peregrinibacteria bacterium]|jgi:hypothetical protein|nr:hypothetical protein [Candidatus Peregrinibacteria bacterium]MBT4055937.1 hypothetical protein [Candidatus Peregrinibacteria bacterium]